MYCDALCLGTLCYRVMKSFSNGDYGSKANASDVFDRLTVKSTTVLEPLIFNLLQLPISDGALSF